jgi:sugar/nucleoside kinase (ribokinase family)
VVGRLVHTGQIFVDLVMRVDRLPPVGGDVLATATDLRVAGAFTVLAAAVRAGAPAAYAGGPGEGRLAELSRAALAAEGIRVVLPPTPGVDVGVCVAMVDRDGERTLVTSAGAELPVEPAALAAVSVSAADVVYLTGYSLLAPAKRATLLGWLDRLPCRPGPRVLLDPGPLVADIDPAAWAVVAARADLLSANLREARLLTGHPHPAAAARELARRGSPGAIVVVRDGAEGCWVAEAGRCVHVPGLAVTAVDTTGAGDVHCGVLAAELLRGTAPVAACARANVAAGLAVTRRGSSTAPTRAEVDAVLRSAPGPADQ